MTKDQQIKVATHRLIGFCKSAAMLIKFPPDALNIEAWARGLIEEAERLEKMLEASLPRIGAGCVRSFI